MKKIYAALGLFLLFSLQACGAQELWEEGEHYVVVSDQATEKPQITEFFSFWCPHCYNFEPLVAKMKQKIGSDVDFTKVHVNFMGFTSADIQDDATKAMLIGRSMGQEDSLNLAVFKHIHVQRGIVAGQSDLEKIFLATGIDPEEYKKKASSFTINSQLKKNNKTIDQFRKHISGVPNFIVNGKYQAKFTREMSADDFVELVVWLTKQK